MFELHWALIGLIVFLSFMGGSKLAWRRANDEWMKVIDGHKEIYKKTQKSIDQLKSELKEFREKELKRLQDVTPK